MYLPSALVFRNHKEKRVGGWGEGEGKRSWTGGAGNGEGLGWFSLGASFGSVDFCNTDVILVLPVSEPKKTSPT